MSKFMELGLSKPTVRAISESGFTEPTDIQIQTIPLAMEGRDVVASAQTGSGKTAAFALPIIECLEETEGYPRALILAPTRELAIQVEEQFERFGKYQKLKTVTLYGGASCSAQIRELKKGVDIIVATPGRLLDFMERKVVDLSKIEILVLDEADRLMDMGFTPQIRKIVAKLPKERQTLMFSATIDDTIQRLVSQYMVDPATVKVNGTRIDPTEIEQRVYHVNEFNKDELLVKLLEELKMKSVIVFTNTKMRAGWVKDRLRAANIHAEEIHGDINQNQREKTLQRYRDGKFQVLVATDVAARGLDIPSITHVVNYDLPNLPEDYVHRIGRTGRAGREGVAVSFVGEGQRFLIKDIEKVIGRSLEPSSGGDATPTRSQADMERIRRFQARSRRRIV